MRHCYVLRVFTRGDEGGNHLGVVTDVTGLRERLMQDIATDLGFSETIYIDWRAGGAPHVRIFTPATELPFAGHPLVGAAWVLGSLGPGTADRMTCEIGEIPFTARRDVGTVHIPGVDDVERTDVGVAVAAAAGLPQPIGAWWARMPIPYLMLEAPDAIGVAEATPDIAALAAGPSGATYLFARSGDAVKARFFAPGFGISEDPATGSAAAALAAVLRAEGEVAGGLMIEQGDEIGAPCTIRLGWSDSGASLSGTVRRDEVRMLDH